ncbi:venom carboxylesterase-6 [Folsomia candida]|uniref:venom carboxylesterase-6 n=1 Tax=Folsomia candida TaxID=158441 RepID=UPI000B907A3E|nr:venom carboxylesterase-6 [Folsomia candida]
MFANFAVTLVCTLLPCTQVVEGPTSAQIEVDLTKAPHTSIYYLPINGVIYPKVYNVSPNYVAIHSSDHQGGVIQGGESRGSGEYLPPPLLADSPHVESSQQADEYPVVGILDGFLKGFTMKTINNRNISAFKSIPFAQPPVGALRFEPPVKNSPWTGIRDAMADSPTCIQADYLLQYNIHGQEDCLYLNVYTPKLPSTKRRQDAPLPVMVWIHGGGWFFSSSSLYGPAYLLDEDVVLVSMNYRLGSLGFLSTGDMTSPGNNGLKDQTLALKWVRENIANFGGDPNKITIFGESAGAGSVHFHMFSPMSRGLFHGAISQSGCATCFWSITEKAAENAQKYSALLNCTGNSKEILSCLKQKDAKDLVFMQLAFLEWTMYPVVIFGPVLEPAHAGSFLSELPETIYKRGGVAPVPWITGLNADEGGINIAVLFIGNGSVDQLNTEWDKYGSIFLDFKNTEANNSARLSNQVRNHYLGNSNISLANRDELIKMFGDRYVITCGIRGMQLHARYSPQPVYAYRLAYRGKYSIVQLLGQSPQDYGVSHLDDLIYLFNNTVYYPNLALEDEEYEVSKIMTRMWSNFARTGRPYLTSTHNQNNNELRNTLTWTPVPRNATPTSPINFMDIKLQPEMVNDPFNERVKFWRSLGLVDE